MTLKLPEVLQIQTYHVNFSLAESQTELRSSANSSAPPHTSSDTWSRTIHRIAMALSVHHTQLNKNSFFASAGVQLTVLFLKVASTRLKASDCPKTKLAWLQHPN